MLYSTLYEHCASNGHNGNGNTAIMTVGEVPDFFLWGYMKNVVCRVKINYL
jgi:hypothetical protein